MNMLQALGATPPVYAHVPMILGPDGARLSKRHGAVSVMQYRDDGYLPEALLNYLVRLGWSHGDQEVFSVDEMVKLFDVTQVHSSAAAFNPEKLLWLNQHYIKNSDPAHVAHHLSYHLGKLGIDPATGPDLIEVVKAQRERAKTLLEMAQTARSSTARSRTTTPKTPPRTSSPKPKAACRPARAAGGVAAVARRTDSRDGDRRRRGARAQARQGGAAAARGDRRPGSVAADRCHALRCSGAKRPLQRLDRALDFPAAFRTIFGLTRAARAGKVARL